MTEPLTLHAAEETLEAVHTGGHTAYPVYKPSDVEWLGDVPEHWDVERLKWSSLDRKGGVWGEEPDDEETGTICIRVADFDRTNLRVRIKNPTLRSIPVKDLKGRLLKKGDLLLEKSGGGEKQLVGSVMLFDHDVRAVNSNFVARMTPSPGYDSHFLVYLHSHLYSSRVNYRSIKQTTGIQNLASDAYLNERVAFPPIEEQQVIARFLDEQTQKIDDLIEAKRRLLDLLKEKRQAVITHAVIRGLDPAVKLKPSGVEWLGDVPEHWEVGQLKRSVLSRKGGVWGDEPEDEHSGIICIRVADFDRKNLRVRIENPTLRSVPENELRGRLLKEGDLLLEKSGGGEKQLVGSVMLFDHNIQAVNSNFVARMTPAPDYDSRYLVFLHAWLYSARINFRSIKQTTGIQNLDSDAYLSEKVAFPPPEEQQAIARFLNKETLKIDDLESVVREAIASLELLRASIISAAVTGKIDVRGAAYRPGHE